MITLPNLSKVTRYALLKVIQSPLARFSYKMLAYAHAINAGPILPAWGPVHRAPERKVAKSEENMGLEVD